MEVEGPGLQELEVKSPTSGWSANIPEQGVMGAELFRLASLLLLMLLLLLPPPPLTALPRPSNSGLTTGRERAGE